MIKESVRKKKFKNKKTIIFAFFLAVAVSIAGVGSSTVNVNAGDSYVDWKELSELINGVEANTQTTVALNGDYKVTQNTTITATTAGVSAITINGATRLYIAKDVTLTVKGANGEGTVGGGAGIYLPSGKTLRIYGEGKLVATGGNSGSAATGNEAKEAKLENGTLITGAGGAGGNGAGSAGAGIGGSGVKGGNGGAGGESQTANETYGNGIDGTKGKSGTKGNAMGTLYLYDTLTIQATAGESTQELINAGSNKDASSGTIGIEDDTMSYMAFASAGGGAGGNAGVSANIGGSGAGGSGGGGGASGGYIIANEGVEIAETSATSAESSSYSEKQTAGGNGGNSGSGSYYIEEDQTVSSDLGTGGTGGSVSAGGNGGTVYCSSGVTLTNPLSGGDDANGEGEEADSYILGMLTAKAYYYDDESKTYKEGIVGGTVASGVHEPGVSVTANTKENSNLAEVSAEPAEEYSFAGWYSGSTETSNFLSGELEYTVDFSNIESEQTVYALFKKATKITAEANGEVEEAIQDRSYTLI